RARVQHFGAELQRHLTEEFESGRAAWYLGYGECMPRGVFTVPLVSFALFACGGRSALDSERAGDAEGSPALFDALSPVADATLRPKDATSEEHRAEGSAGSAPSEATTDSIPSATPDAATDVCAPVTCAQLGYDCGFTDDGCGHTLDCNAAVDESAPSPASQYC